MKSALNDNANDEGMSKERDAFVEGTTVDKGKEKNIEPALNDMANKTDTRRIRDALHDMLTPTTDKGTEELIDKARERQIDKAQKKSIEPALNNVVNDLNTLCDMIGDMLVEAMDKAKEKQSEPIVEGPKKRKRKGKSKKRKRPTDNGNDDKGKNKENDDFVEASTLNKGKGKESELLVKGSARDKGKNEGIGLPPAQHEVQGKKSNDDEGEMTQERLDLIREATDSISKDEYDRIMAKLRSTGLIAYYHDPKVAEVQKEAGLASGKMIRLMTDAIRPQTAALRQLDLFCRFVEDNYFFKLMYRHIEELRWNR